MSSTILVYRSTPAVRTRFALQPGFLLHSFRALAWLADRLGTLRGGLLAVSYVMLLGLRAGLDRPSEGDVELAGSSLAQLDEDARASLRADRVRAFARLPDGSSDWEPLRADRQWWLAWSEFHPGTSIYQDASS